MDRIPDSDEEVKEGPPMQMSKAHTEMPKQSKVVLDDMLDELCGSSDDDKQNQTIISPSVATLTKQKQSLKLDLEKIISEEKEDLENERSSARKREQLLKEQEELMADIEKQTQLKTKAEMAFLVKEA